MLREVTAVIHHNGRWHRGSDADVCLADLGTNFTGLPGTSCRRFGDFQLESSGGASPGKPQGTTHCSPRIGCMQMGQSTSSSQRRRRQHTNTLLQMLLLLLAKQCWCH